MLCNICYNSLDDTFSRFYYKCGICQKLVITCEKCFDEYMYYKADSRYSIPYTDCLSCVRDKKLQEVLK